MILQFFQRLFGKRATDFPPAAPQQTADPSIHSSGHSIMGTVSPDPFGPVYNSMPAPVEIPPMESDCDPGESCDDSGSGDDSGGDSGGGDMGGGGGGWN